MKLPDAGAGVCRDDSPTRYPGDDVLDTGDLDAGLVFEGAVTEVEECRRVLCGELRELRCAAGHTATSLAALCGWQISKISKIEHGKQNPTEDDIRRWCAGCDAEPAAPNLIGTLRRLSKASSQWRQMSSIRRHRRQINDIEADSSVVRGYAPDLIPGLLQTREYAAAALAANPLARRGYQDVAVAVSARLCRQQILREGNRRFHLLIGEQALYTSVGGDDLMLAQLRRLIDLMPLPRLVLGVVPRSAELRSSTNNFLMYDRKMVRVETLTAHLSISQPRELLLYERTFRWLAEQAAFGERAQRLILSAAVHRTSKKISCR